VYYRVRGWHENGAPRKRTLRKLRIQA